MGLEVSRALVRFRIGFQQICIVACFLEVLINSSVRGSRYDYQEKASKDLPSDIGDEVVGHYDKEIPIGPCDIGNEDWWWLSGGTNYYCP